MYLMPKVESQAKFATLIAWQATKQTQKVCFVA